LKSCFKVFQLCLKNKFRVWNQNFVSGRDLLEIVAIIAGAMLIAVILWEGFEIIILPRRVTRRFRLSRFFFVSSWHAWKFTVNLLPGRFQGTWLSFFGPLFILFMLIFWVSGLIVGFALLYWASDAMSHTPEGKYGFLRDLYQSGTTFFTLGLGDVVPRNAMARIFTVIESGMGFGFLALVLSFLPALNRSFSRREVSIALLDARAGSPPSASEMLRRHYGRHGLDALQQLLREWERWAAEFLEDHLSYPVVAYFRSQHDNQSWLAALTAILDTCALSMVGPKNNCRLQAELTFASARHAVADLCLVFGQRPLKPDHDRLPQETYHEMITQLKTAGFNITDEEKARARLVELRLMYEPQVHVLSHYFQIHMPPWHLSRAKRDNWQTGIKEAAHPGTGPEEHDENEHF
jgi:hypothetical protein